MSKRRRAVVILVSVCVLAAVAVGAAVLYRTHHPRIYITCGVGTRDDAGFHSERVEVVIGGREGVPVAKSVREELEKLQKWNDGVDSALAAYRTNEPYDIRVSGESGGGKVTLRYEGYVTEENGEGRDILEEMTFDLPVRERDFDLPAMT